MIEINGRQYPLWSQFVERKDEWIGGILEEIGDSFPMMFDVGNNPMTEITDITLLPNGSESAMFHVAGELFSCGGDVSCLGIVGGEKGWITLSGYGGHTWRIKPKKPCNT